MTSNKQPNDHPFANLFEEAANITKAHGYDILTKQVVELKEENERLKATAESWSEMAKTAAEEAVRVKEQSKELISTLNDALFYLNGYVVQEGTESPTLKNKLKQYQETLSKYTKQ